MERKQFTFYESFSRAVKRIKKDSDRAKAYDIICDYALYNIEPDLDSVPDAVAIAFELIRPNLDTSRRKAENGLKGGRAKQNESKTKATRKQNEANAKQEEIESKKEKEYEIENKREDEIEIEKEKEYKIENDSYIYNTPPPPSRGTKVNADFEKFWSAYPKKVGKQAALKAFQKAKDVPVEVMLTAIEQQKQGNQWQRDGGQYIPNPATWLNQGRWEDEPPKDPTPPTTPESSGNPFFDLVNSGKLDNTIDPSDTPDNFWRQAMRRAGLEG